MLSLALTVAFVGNATANEAFKGLLGVLQSNPGVTDGYVLITPQYSKVTYLIDNDGKIVNQWTSEHNGFYAELLPNGNLARHSRLSTAEPQFGGTGGLIEEFDWSGKKVWEYQFFTPDKEVSHHVFGTMPNGNYLVLGWEYKSYEEAIAKGLDVNANGRTLFKDGHKEPNGHQVVGIWPDFLREIDRKTGNTVWEWHVWDNLGTGKDQFNINKFVSRNLYRPFAGADWTHFNGVSYNAATDQVCLTSRNFGEVYILDRKTNKITFRWGNPWMYDNGKAPFGYTEDGDQQLFGPHAPMWTKEGNITILDNGTARPSGNYTRAVELDPKTGKIVWEWDPRSVKAQGGNFYSAFQCGVQKLDNGNYIITSTNDGHVVEVTAAKNIVWEFTNPVNKGNIYKTTSAHGTGGDAIHRAMRYAKNFSGFAGKEFKSLGQFPNWISVLSADPAPLKPL